MQGGWQAEDRAQAEDAVAQSHAHELAIRGVQIISTAAAAAGKPTDVQMKDNMGPTLQSEGSVSTSAAGLVSANLDGKDCFEGNVLRNLAWRASIDVTAAMKRQLGGSPPVPGTES